MKNHQIAIMFLIVVIAVGALFCYTHQQDVYNFMNKTGIMNVVNKYRTNYGKYNADGSPMWKGYDSERIIDVNGNTWVYVEDWSCWQKQKKVSKSSDIQYSDWAKNTPGEEIFGKITVNMGGAQ